MPVLTLAEAVDRAGACRGGGARVVFTNGVYDLLHPGHVRYLEAARREGDLLIVGVNTDASVRRNKGPDRPITPEAERAEVIAALACVDAAVLFDEDTPASIIAALQPDVLVKGADWPARSDRRTRHRRGARRARRPHPDRAGPLELHLIERVPTNGPAGELGGARRVA
jgi:rfaE bifunctional protein nucleotidyltransferase chain/domain